MTAPGWIFNDDRRIGGFGECHRLTGHYSSLPQPRLQRRRCDQPLAVQPTSVLVARSECPGRVQRLRPALAAHTGDIFGDHVHSPRRCHNKAL
jgi:hypothetical protein